MLVEGSRPRSLTTISAANKAANCLLTIAAGDPYWLRAGASVYITGTAIATLDNKWHKVVSLAGTALTINTDTTSDPGTFTPGGTLAVRDTPTPQ